MTSQAGSHGGSGSTSGRDDVSTANAPGAGFKVYGSVFKTDPRYEFLNPLGKGSYGIVCAARDRETGQRIAIKKVCPMAKRSVDAKHTLREVLLLQLLGKHPNIISMHNLSTNLQDDELYIVMDLMDTDMHRVIQSSQTLSESHVKYFLHQLLRGVKYLHDNGVLHRDLKPGNLLLTKTCQLKIADFGLARKTQRSKTGNNGITSLERPRSAPVMSHGSSVSAKDRAPMTEHVVTRWYRAPELMLQPDGFYDESVDMWSVGCIFAEILGRKALFPGKNFLHQLTLIFDIIGTPPPEATARIKSSQAQRFLKSLGKKPRVPFRTVFPTASDEALDLLERLLEFDPEKRISAQDALAHPFMQPVERKYKGVDPHPSARVDFSFDTKKLTKMDLRALIIKEVENFRRSVAHTAAVDADLAAETSIDKTSHSAAASTAKPSVAQSERDTTKPRPSSASAAATHAGGRVMCGSAGISMIHSAMRQRVDNESVNKGESGPAVCSIINRPSSAAPTSHASAAIGSSRQRIRVNTKPPVPKQPLVPSNGVAVPEPQGLVRVVAVQDAKSLLTSSSATKQEESEPRRSDATTNMSDSSDSRVDTTATVPSKAPQTTHSTGFALAEVSRPAQHESVGDPAVKAAAVSAFSSFEQRSKMLMAPASATSWAAPVASLHLAKATTTTTNATTSRPEVSHSPPRSPASSSSSSSSSSDSSTGDRSQNIASLKSRPGHLTDRSTANEAAHAELPRRRVASAGPIRSKPVGTIITSVHKPQPRHNTASTAFVGSTTSLIRAQRSINGKSLADSADQMVAKMTARHDMNLTQEPRATREPRDESCVDASEPTLKPQRSTTQLNQLEPTSKKPTRKLTVPKSPKFSVMSWQKKKELRVTKATSSSGDPMAGHVISRR